MSFIWTNSTKSGLCDRLIDLFIIASLSKFLEANIFVYRSINNYNFNTSGD